jgi:hypothetical protein
MGRFVERIAHKPSLHHSAYSVRTGQCVSCVVTAVVILSCVRCEAGFCVDAFYCSISIRFVTLFKSILLPSAAEFMAVLLIMSFKN